MHAALHTRGRRGVLGLATAGALLPWRGLAGSLQLGGSSLGGGMPTLRLESFQERRFRHTVPQAHDFSCGSAAVATLLTHIYGIPTPEREVFDGMIEHGDAAVIGREGFSLLDMKVYLRRRGIAAEGFRAPLAKLVEVRVPAIVLISVRGYNHFVVLTGVRGGRVLMSDPSSGLRTATIPEFERMWNGIFFLVLAEVETAQRRFNDAGHWTLAPTAPNALARYALDFALLAQPAGRAEGRF